MSDYANYEAWNKANDNRTYFALSLAMGYVDGDTAEVEHFARLFEGADADMDFLDRELGKQK